MDDDFDLVITKGLCVTAADIAPFDIAIKGEKIVLLAPSGSLEKARSKHTIDAEGGYVMPGGIDAHVHLQEPSLFGKGSSADTYETGTRSAIAGGTTTVVCFAPQERSLDSLAAALGRTCELARDSCYCDYGLHLLVGNPSAAALAELPRLASAEEGVTSLKVYMTYAALQLRDDQILSVLLAARRSRLLTMIHAENGDALGWLTGRLEAAGLLAPKYHAHAHAPVLESEATGRAVALSALVANTPILLVHVSSPAAAQRIREAQAAGGGGCRPVFAETCPQYLFLSREDLDRPGFEGAKYVCAPPPRQGAADQRAIWDGLRDGTFAVLSSDHCAFRFDDAQKGKKAACVAEEEPLGRFRHIPNGLPGVETRLPLTLCAGRLPLTRLVEVCSTNAAKLYGMYPRKGSLIPGVSDADLVVWYPEGRLGEFTLTNAMLHHNVDYTPYEGRVLNNWPRYTILRGRVVWDRDGGGIVGEKGYGRFVKRRESSLNDVWKTVEEEGPFDLEKL
ncbi:D-hydantoinase [Biscogniauxia mediterranea]|nr:D-hydantoinase [Biscogniauxia mediterranea]